MIRGSVISSIANRSPSRPKPESFEPPYGIWSARNAEHVVHDHAADLEVAVRLERAVDVVREHAGLQAVRASRSPSASASSNVWYGLIVTTGPKTSSRQTFISGRDVRDQRRLEERPLARAAGEHLGALGRPPPRTHSSIRSTSLRWITGPTSTVGSIGSPTFRLSTCFTSRAAKSS